MLKKTEGATKNGQSRETGNIGYTRHRPKINVRENIRGNQEWTIQKKIVTLDTHDTDRK